MNTAKTLKTERLLLRPWKPEDLEHFVRLNADSRVREYFLSVMSPEESQEQMQRFSEHIESYGWGFWAATLLETGELIGMIGIHPVNFEVPFTPAVEIGWRLAYDHWGKGYATEGAKAVLRYGFETLNLEEIVSFTAALNLRSQRVMQKIGMHYDPKDDFDHPKVKEGHPLRRSVLYRMNRLQWKELMGHDPKEEFNGERMVKALTDREWDAVRSLRNRNFFTTKPDPFTWTFTHPDHIHFVFYKNAEIVGYAHLQLWPNLRAALRIIVIEESYRHQGLGTQFLKLCERWLSQQGFKKLHIQSSKKAYPFYRAHGYLEMPFEDPDGYESDPQDIEIGKCLMNHCPKKID